MPPKCALIVPHINTINACIKYFLLDKNHQNSINVGQLYILSCKTVWTFSIFEKKIARLNMMSEGDCTLKYNILIGRGTAHYCIVR